MENTELLKILATAGGTFDSFENSGGFQSAVKQINNASQLQVLEVKLRDALDIVQTRRAELAKTSDGTMER